MSAIVLAILYLVIVGYLPALAVSRSGVLAVPLSGLVAGLVSTAAVVGSLVTRTALLPWLLACVACSWGAAAVVLSRPARREPLALVRPSAVAVVAGISVVVLAATTAAPTEWDAHMIWFFHVSWFSQGGDVARDAMANPALSTSHADYPPLAPATVAGLWSIIDGGSLRLAQAVTSVQSWMAVVLAGSLAVSVARREAQVAVAGLAGLFALGCFGVAGGFGTRGYADLLWAGAAVSAALALLVLPVTGQAQLVGAACLAVAMLTKAEGLVSGIAVFLPLVVLRVARLERRGAARRLRPVLGMALVAACWPVLAGRYVAGAARDVSPGSLQALLSGDGDKLDRLEPTFNGLLGYTRLTLLSAGIAIGAGWLVQRRGERGGLGSPWWLPVAAVGCFTMSFVVIAAGELEVHFYVATGGFRTMTVVRMLLLAEVLVTAAIVVDQAAGRRAASGQGRRGEQVPDHEEAGTADRPQVGGGLVELGGGRLGRRDVGHGDHRDHHDLGRRHEREHRPTRPSFGRSKGRK